MTQKLRIIVTGLIAQYPMGGVSWDYFQYVLGLSRLGHEVYYLEDTGFWPYNPQENGLSQNGCQFNIDYTQKIFEAYGLGDRWMFKFCCDTNKHEWYGLADRKREEVLNSADLLINVSGCLSEPEKYCSVKRLAYIDSDPVFTQVKLALGYETFHDQIQCHDKHFTFAENPNHVMPMTKFTWQATRQPVVLSEWMTSVKPSNVFTTIMNWTSYDALKYQGVEYGQKDQEFKKYLTLPSLLKAQNIDCTLELAVNQGKTTKTPYQALIKQGWILSDPSAVCPDLSSYRDYIQSSKAEWSVAKHGYVQGQSGWFSCRSACYLASGRPVVVQDTGFSHVLPCGSGLHAFSSLDEALDGIESVNAQYQSECSRAREIADEYFNSDRVLSKLIDAAMSDLTLSVDGTEIDLEPLQMESAQRAA